MTLHTFDGATVVATVGNRMHTTGNVNEKLQAPHNSKSGAVGRMQPPATYHRLNACKHVAWARCWCWTDAEQFGWSEATKDTSRKSEPRKFGTSRGGRRGQARWRCFGQLEGLPEGCHHESALNDSLVVLRASGPQSDSHRDASGCSHVPVARIPYTYTVRAFSPCGTNVRC